MPNQRQIAEQLFANMVVAQYERTDCIDLITKALEHAYEEGKEKGWDECMGKWAEGEY